jgi:hypothetical protein
LSQGRKACQHEYEWRNLEEVVAHREFLLCPGRGVDRTINRLSLG